jgi:hypothetical protein
VIDALEVDGHVVDDWEEGTTNGDGDTGHDQVRSVSDDAWYDHGTLAHPPLIGRPNEEDENKTDEETNDFGASPAVFSLAVLNTKNEANSCSDEKTNTDEIHLQHFLLQGDPGWLRLGWVTEEEGDDSDGDGANRQVDVEAPSPRDLISEDTTD